MIITILVAAFIAAVTACAVVVLRAGIAREESEMSLLGQPSTRMAAMTRRAVGLYVRKTELAIRNVPTSPSQAIPADTPPSTPAGIAPPSQEALPS